MAFAINAETVEAESHKKNVVRYHVSDFLKDRHPYQQDKSFETQRARDMGKVYSGFLPMGLDALVASLTSEEIDVSQRAIALAHLIGHSAAPEQKIVLLRKGLVAVLALLLSPQHNPTPQIEQLCCRLLRSLAILPQGCHAVVSEGGLEALTQVVGNRANAKERESARTAAVDAVVQLCSSWEGRGWIFGIGVPPDLTLLGYQHPPAMDLSRADAQAQALCDCLVLVLNEDHASLMMVQHAMHALALLTLDEEGLNKALIAGALRAASSVLRRCAADDAWVFVDGRVEAGITLHAATMVWHVALDDLGKKECERVEENPLISPLGKLVSSVLGAKDRLLTLKASLAGALCALVLHPPMKSEALLPLDDVPGKRPTVELILELLRQTNTQFEPLRAAKKSAGGAFSRAQQVQHDETLSLVKNLVQAVRLISELPRAVAVLEELLDPQKERLLRRQLFVSTQHEQRFGVSMFE